MTSDQYMNMNQWNEQSVNGKHKFYYLNKKWKNVKTKEFIILHLFHTVCVLCAL